MAKGNTILNEINVNRIQEQQKLYHPSSRFKSLVQAKNFYILEGEDISVEGTPFLQWSVPKSTEGGLQPGWKVALIGANEISVQFAQWDDKEGIDRLVNSLSNKNQLLTTLAFINPESTAKLASRRAVTELKNARSLPAVKMTAIRKMIKDLNLDTNPPDTSYHSSYGYLTSLFIKVGDIKTPVAIRVDPSRSPRWKKVLPPYTAEKIHDMTSAQKSAYQTKRSADLEIIEKETRQEWIRQFRLGMADMAGWRFVSLPNVEYSYSTTKQPEAIWVTRIPLRTWEIIAPAVIATAKSARFRSSKF